MPSATPRTRPGRPRDPRLDQAILSTAERQLRERGYALMSLESVAAAAGTTVPTLRRRYRDKTALAAAVVDSMRVDPLPTEPAAPREAALALLENFRRNLGRPHSLALLGSLLSEEERSPELIGRFRKRLVGPRRARLAEALKRGVEGGDLPAQTDIDAAVSMLIGSFYARYISHGSIPRDWARRVLNQLWPPK
jgi:AcrR family transcriptional regulator